MVSTPLKNISQYDSSQHMESHKIHVPNHQPDTVYTTYNLSSSQKWPTFTVRKRLTWLSGKSKASQGMPSRLGRRDLPWDEPPNNGEFPLEKMEVYTV